MAKANEEKLNIEPTAGFVLIEPLEAEEVTASGIYLPDNATEKPKEGKVLAVGADQVTDSGAKKTSPVKPGQIVVYKKGWDNEVKVKGKEYLFIKFDDILGIFNK